MLLILFLLILFTPLRLRLQLQMGRGTAGRLTIWLWGVRQDVPFRLEKGQLILPGRPPRTMHAEPEQGKQFLMGVGTLLRTDQARRLIKQYVQLEALRIGVRLALSDAAATAMVTGALRSLPTLLPCDWQKRVRIHVVPDFLAQGTMGQGECIIFTHLGILLITGVMLLTAWKREQREHQQAREAET